MTNPLRRASTRSRSGRPAALTLETLERRDLLAVGTLPVMSTPTNSSTFAPPSLNGLISQAENGVNTGPAAIQTMLQSLEQQAINGPLADFNAGTVTASGLVSEVQGLVTGYESSVASQLSAFPNISNILDLEGTNLVNAVTAVSEQSTAGIIASTDLAADFTTAINSLTNGPLQPLSTQNGGYVLATKSLETSLNALATGLTATSSTLTVATVQTVAAADVNAYQAAVDASLAVYPNIRSQVDTAVSTLQTAVTGLDTTSPTSAQTALTAAVTAFDAALLGSGGTFAANGRVARFLNSL